MRRVLLAAIVLAAPAAAAQRTITPALGEAEISQRQARVAVRSSSESAAPASELTPMVNRAAALPPPLAATAPDSSRAVATARAGATAAAAPPRVEPGVPVRVRRAASAAAEARRPHIPGEAVRIQAPLAGRRSAPVAGDAIRVEALAPRD